VVKNHPLRLYDSAKSVNVLNCIWCKSESPDV